MMQTQKKSICILADCLTGGGAEKMASLLSKSLFDAGYKVSIIIMQEGVHYDYKGELYNLGMIKHRIGFFKTIRKLWKLKKVYNKINADVYLDFRVKNSFIKEFILNTFFYKISKTIQTIHSYRVHNYLPKSKYLYNMYNKSIAVVCVSKGIYAKTSELFDFDNLVYIPNFFSEDIFIKSNKAEINIKEPYILAIGRLKNKIKQFDKLIVSYKESKPALNGVPLIILGDGEDKSDLEKLIEHNNLKGLVKLLGFKKNPYPYIKSSKFLVMSSKVEGFGMVLVDSLALGVPVISFDCKTGPSEVIENNVNGILVKDQDFKAFTRAIDDMYLDKELYSKFKLNSNPSVQKYSKDHVFKQWIELIEA